MQPIKTIFHLFRVHHWIKNLFMFAPLLFAGKLHEKDSLGKVIIGFIIFCMTASAVYMFNDIKDRNRDKEHPRKSKRPIASGAVSIRTAAITGILLLVLSGCIARNYLPPVFGYTLLTYIGINVLYSLYLKHVVLLDVFLVASGFVMRVMAGGFAAEIPNSQWMLICTILLALFLGFAKRRHELVLLGDDAKDHRGILAEYSTKLLDRIIGILGACTIMAYMLYTIAEDTVTKFGSNYLLYTSIFVMYGIFRYLYLVYQKEEGGSPTRIMLTDTHIIITVLAWAGICGSIVYFF